MSITSNDIQLQSFHSVHDASQEHQQIRALSKENSIISGDISKNSMNPDEVWQKALERLTNQYEDIKSRFVQRITLCKSHYQRIYLFFVQTSNLYQKAFNLNERIKGNVYVYFKSSNSLEQKLSLEDMITQFRQYVRTEMLLAIFDMCSLNDLKNQCHHINDHAGNPSLNKAIVLGKLELLKKSYHFFLKKCKTIELTADQLLLSINEPTCWSTNMSMFLDQLKQFDDSSPGAGSETKVIDSNYAQQQLQDRINSFFDNLSPIEKGIDSSLHVQPMFVAPRNPINSISSIRSEDMTMQLKNLTHCFGQLRAHFVQIISAFHKRCCAYYIQIQQYHIQIQQYPRSLLNDNVMSSSILIIQNRIRTINSLEKTCNELEKTHACLDLTKIEKKLSLLKSLYQCLCENYKIVSQEVKEAQKPDTRSKDFLKNFPSILMRAEKNVFINLNMSTFHQLYDSPIDHATKHVLRTSMPSNFCSISSSDDYSPQQMQDIIDSLIGHLFFMESESNTSQIQQISICEDINQISLSDDLTNHNLEDKEIYMHVKNFMYQCEQRKVHILQMSNIFHKYCCAYRIQAQTQHRSLLKSNIIMPLSISIIQNEMYMMNDWWDDWDDLLFALDDHGFNQTPDMMLMLPGIFSKIFLLKESYQFLLKNYKIIAKAIETVNTCQDEVADDNLENFLVVLMHVEKNMFTRKYSFPHYSNNMSEFLEKFNNISSRIQHNISSRIQQCSKSLLHRVHNKSKKIIKKSVRVRNKAISPSILTRSKHMMCTRNGNYIKKI